jgi:CubicO group peptidase (beta-lactamase class C family)
MNNLSIKSIAHFAKVNAIILLLLISMSACSNYLSPTNEDAFVSKTSTEKTTFQQHQKDSLTSYIEQHLETTGMLILQDGNVIFEYGDIEEVSYLASCRKSVLSILYGKYVEDGTIDLNETIGAIGIDEKDGLLPIEKQATVEDIITSRSGVFHQPANGGYDENNILKRGSVQPGEYFVYNNWDFNVAGHILAEKSGKSVYQELEEQLAIPLGFQDWDIKNQKEKSAKRKSNYPAYHMYISTRDMAKIGQLLLNKGKWNEKQIVSEEWIEKITTTVTPTDTLNARYGRDKNSDHQFSYGYMWWIIESIHNHPDFEGAYTATGWGGQYITVIPKLNVVIAHKYTVPTLVNWGLKSGGVSEYEYWELLYRFVTLGS